jgi:hypothetical protein
MSENKNQAANHIMKKIRTTKITLSTFLLSNDSLSNKLDFIHIIGILFYSQSVSNVQLRPRNFVSYFTVNSKKHVYPKLYCHYD